MKESYKVRPSQSPWPRVMRCVGQPAGRSVHRGTTGLCIDLRKRPFVVADLVLKRGRQQSCRTSKASPTGPSRSLRPQARLETFLTEAERPRCHPFFHGTGSVGEGARPQFRHARRRGVTQFHSTGETGEQGRRGAACEVGGGKGSDQ